MSHTTTVKGVVVRSVSALRAAVEELSRQGVDIHLVENAKPRMYYPHQEVPCEYVARLDSAKHGGKTYDIGFQKNAEGTYDPIYDVWGNAVPGQIGAACPMPNTDEGRAMHHIGRLLQEYARFAATEAAVSAGHMVTGCVKDAAGNYQLTVGVH